MSIENHHNIQIGKRTALKSHFTRGGMKNSPRWIFRDKSLKKSFSLRTNLTLSQMYSQITPQNLKLRIQGKVFDFEVCWSHFPKSEQFLANIYSN